MIRDDIFHDIGNIAQPGERPPDAREVMGSSPIVPSKKPESVTCKRIPALFLFFSQSDSLQASLQNPVHIGDGHPVV